MSIQDFLDRCEDSVDFAGDFTIMWSEKGRGFGQYCFYTGTDGKIHIVNECDGKETIKRLLNKMVDEAILDDEPLRRCPVEDDNK
jgi:hypothetical protein